jgi:hypothetical protein
VARPISLASVSLVWVLYKGLAKIEDYIMSNDVLSAYELFRDWAVWGAVPAMIGFFVAFVWLAFVFTN